MLYFSKRSNFSNFPNNQSIIHYFRTKLYIVEALGARISLTLHDSVTHVIYESGSTKDREVEQAKKRGL